MEKQFDLQESQRLLSKRQFDLTLYFRQIQINCIKKITCVEIYQDSIYLGTSEFLVYVYELRQSQNLAMELHNQKVFSAQCTAAKFIVASEKFLIVIPNKQQQLLRLWNRQTLQLSHTYYGHDSQMTAAIFLQDGLHIASCSIDKTIRIWQISEQYHYNREKAHYKGIFPFLTLTQVAENTLAFGGDDSYITIWNWMEDQVRYKCYAHLGSIMSLQICNNYLYSVGGDSKIKAWDIQRYDKTKKYLTKVKQHKKKFNHEVFTIKISQHQIISIDSKGHTYLMNGKLELGGSRLKIKYTETIRSIKIWNNRLFIVLRSEQKAQLKQILVNIEQLRTNAKLKDVIPTINSIKSLQDNNVRLSWKKLSLNDRKTGNSILKGLNGYFQGGEFVSIMGASGSGKSSLLSIISCRLRQQNAKLRIEGDFLINNQTYDLKDFSRVAAYVEQDDVLFGALTVRQTFQFYAKMKLWKYSPQEQKQRCSRLLTKLNLQQCSQVLVSNSFFQKSISGGQKKRLAIGIQLISNPKILIFDEPTSGLDSHNALVIVRQLAKLAKQENKLIIITIHQPSTLIFQQFDHLYLLKKGMCVYNGKANEVIRYMENLGIEINLRMNPADFFMFQISTFKENKGYESPLNWENCERNTVLPERFYQLESVKHKSIIKVTETVPFSKHYVPLLERGWKSLYRTPSNQLNKLVVAFLIPIFLGILYNDIGDQIPSTYDQATGQTFLLNFFCYIFMAHFFVFTMNVYETVLIFPNQKQIVLRQTQNNLYSIYSYYFAKVSSQILGCIIPAFISGVLIYLAGNLNLSPNYFGVYIGIYILLALLGLFFGLMYGVLNKSSQKAITLLTIVLMPILIYGGLLVNINDIPIYVRWLQYLSPIRHSFQIIFQSQISAPQFNVYQGQSIPQKYGLNGDTGIALVCMFSILVVLIVLSLLLLMKAKRSL